MNVLPVFRTHYSLGKSILTLAAPEKELDPNYPVSVFDIAKKHNLSNVVVVDESISGFLEAHQNAHKAKVKLTYGVQLRCMASIDNKCDAALKTIHKIIILIKNTQGYSDLIKITSCAAKKGFYYKPNIDLQHLKEMWTDNLMLVIPFYDGFLFQNSVYGHICVPSFGFAKPTFFLENSTLPFDKLVQTKTLQYVQSVGAETLLARSIYYYQRSDFLAYLTFRCIHERSKLERPELEHCSSDAFSFETWEEQDKNPALVTI